jgi:hypothetical protein
MGMTVKSLPLPPYYTPAKVPVVLPEGKPPGESPRIGLATSQAHETFGLDLQLAPLTLPSGSDPSEIKVETRETSSAVYINRIIEVARSRATLISKIRELLLRGETQEAISLVRMLCGLEN